MLNTQYSILSIDTSTQVCSVAIHINGILAANIETYKENSHSENLTLMIDQVSKFAGIQLSEISAFALSRGPGSYTGLRIGCSALKGLCFALDKPLIAISTLQLMAHGLKPMAENVDFICPMIDAKRMEVYQGLFDKFGNVVEIEKPLVLEKSSFNDYSDSMILFAGNGSDKCKSLFSNSKFIFITGYHPLAKNMGDLAYQAFLQNDFVDVAYFEPEYLKDFYTSAKVLE
ncbi:MAG: tRNA (adenosine(37)-N6)-threonylcarbamoyltransferase complex dimerization subunit type 1 TsaB [Opitutaceae bacterium]|nr:tRNA (adenosine(37)-N6)-threonylcarbamoyltransferase complex dimerization subunit type 1 TsaB [Cytophagales bacterium]